MRRLLEVTVGGALVASLSLGALVLTGLESAQATTCGDDCVTDGTHKPDTPGWPRREVPEEEAVYCSDPAFPILHRVREGQFQTADDTSIVSPFSGSGPAYVDRGGPIVIPEIAVTQKVVQWCTGDASTDQANYNEFWVPLATPDSVALTAGLLAKVQGRLSMPAVTWLDIDKDHDWLWVNYDHHVAISPPVPVNESATDGNLVTGFATAWVKATPVSFTIEMPKETGVRGTQLALCDLTKATSDKGCKIKFTHASSVSDDGWFTGSATVTWTVSSNSGKYDGVGPFTTSSEVRIRVAESMAVSVPDN